MLRFFSIFGLLCLILFAAPTMAQDAAWHEVLSNDLARVEVETTLYEKHGESYFYIHVRVVNLASTPIGVDMRDKNRVVYPNQWEARPQRRRGIVDERRMVQETVEGAVVSMLYESFKEKKIDTIPPRGSLEYYTAFKGEGRMAVARQADKPHLMVSLDGQVITTDGGRLGVLMLDWDKAPKPATELWLSRPIKWSPLPENARVIAR